MSLQNLLSQASNGVSQLTGAGDQNQNSQQSGLLASVTNAIPGGLAGGAAAGGVMALLMGSKSTRKMMKKVAKYGGSAVIGGLAYKAYDNWRNNKPMDSSQPTPLQEQDITSAQRNLPVLSTPEQVSHQMTIIMSMVAAAKADGHIDNVEQKAIFEATESLALSADEKASLFELMSRDIPIDEIVSNIVNEESKAEVYMAACLAIDIDEESERAHLEALAEALQLPAGLPAYLEQQAAAA